MKRIKQVIAFLLLAATVLLCGGCAREGLGLSGPDNSYTEHREKIANMEQTGDFTFISGVRTGGGSNGSSFGNHAFECTDDGVYYLAVTPVQYEVEGKTQQGNAPFLFFSPHDSDQIIKLCGRPDCSHEIMSCNACYQGACSGVTYYNGHLYIAIQAETGKQLIDLYRIDLDGSNRVKLGSFGDRSKYVGPAFVLVIDGVFTYCLYYLDSKTGDAVYDRFYYPLDGSLSKPVQSDKMFLLMNQEGMTTHTVEKGGEHVHQIYHVDLRNDQWTLAFETTKYETGYWGRECGYVLADNKLIKVDYRDGQEEVLFDTGLEGTYFPRFFPDCIVLTQTADSSGELPEVPMIYFFDWDGTNLGELPVDFDYNLPSVTAIMGGGETRDRFYLWTSKRQDRLPTYFIEKSDFETGSITLHKCQYPDADLPGVS